MMEFLMSRLTMGICGMVILAAAVVPMSSVLEDRQDVDYQQQIDRIANMIDSFYDSDVMVMTVSGADIIPDGCTLANNGTILTLVHTT